MSELQGVSTSSPITTLPQTQQNPATEAKTTGTLSAQSNGTAHSVQKSFVPALLEKILNVFSKNKPPAEAAELKEAIGTLKQVLCNCEKEISKPKSEEASTQALNAKLKQSEDMIANLSTIEETLKKLKADPRAQSKSVQKSLETSLAECVTLKDQCQHAIHTYQGKLGQTPPEVTSYFPEAQIEATPTGEIQVKASPEQLSRQAQYLANTYDGKKATESMYRDEKLTDTVTISNGLKGKAEKTITAAEQMLKDLGRTRVSIDGKPLSSKIGGAQQFSIAEKILNRFGEDGLKKFGPILHQSLFADFHTQLFDGKRDTDGNRIEAGLGLGSPRNITPQEYRAQVDTSLSDEELKNMLAPRFNIQERRDGSIVVTGTLITGFVPVAMGDSETDRYGFCETTVEVIISKEEFAKSNPEDMQLIIKARNSEVITPGFSQIEKFVAKQAKIEKKQLKAEKKEAEKLKKAAAATQLTKPETKKSEKVTKASSQPIENEGLDSLEKKCNKLLFLKEPQGCAPLTDDIMSKLANKAFTDLRARQIVNKLVTRYSKGTEVTPKTTERGIPQEGGSRKNPAMTMSLADYILIQELTAEASQK